MALVKGVTIGWDIPPGGRSLGSGIAWGATGPGLMGGAGIGGTGIG